jgi:hypothetical protein
MTFKTAALLAACLALAHPAAAGNRLTGRAHAAPQVAHFGDPGEAGEPTMPAQLQPLRAELLRFHYCPDEAGPEGEDWWGFWWSLPDRGCGDCEDFAAYSYARLEQLGVERGAMRLMAAGVGQLRQRNGEQAELLPVWLEVDLAGETWTVWNQQIRPGTWRSGSMLASADVEALVDRRFGPNWPYGVGLP